MLTLFNAGQAGQQGIGAGALAILMIVMRRNILKFIASEIFMADAHEY